MSRVLTQIWIVIGALVAGFVLSWGVYMPNADQRGVWRAEADGMILTLTPLRATLYSETAVSCTQSLRFPAHLKLVDLAEGLVITADGTRLSLSNDSTLAPITFTRINALPTTCGTADPQASAQQVFDALWSAINDHYAYFDLHDIDWDARRALRPTDQTLSDADLFARLSEALQGLNDPQVQLGAPFAYFSPAQPPMGNIADLWQTARDTIGTALTPVDLTGIEYTVLPDGIAYVMIRSAGVDTPFGAKDRDAMALAFAHVAEELAEAKALILDLRYAQAGSDSAALGIASHFTAEPVDIFTKTTRMGDAQTAPFTARLIPFDSTPLTQPVIVLTSQMTSPAAQTLVLALNDQPQVTTLGGATSGTLSDRLAIRLPNGWELGLPHQTYRALDGTAYHLTGLIPDVALAIDAQALERGEDAVLRAAFARARAQ